jgi:DNA mismatch endonuclease (patch repair protein)
MQGNRSRDTAPELALRRELHSRGMRYRVATAPLPGVRRRVDIEFPRAKVVVFVDGCFWHGCPEHHRLPKTHTDYWAGKVEGNAARDRQTTQLLEEAGWTVLRFWEHEPVAEVADVVERVVRELRADRTASG